MSFDTVPTYFERPPGSNPDASTEDLVGASPTLAETRDALRQVYGENGLAWYDHFAETEPDLSPGQLLRRYRNQPCSDHTAFYRHYDALAELPRYVAPEVATNGHLSMTSIGGSGEEVWSFAAELKQAIRLGGGNAFHSGPPLESFDIKAFSVNQTVLDRAYGPYHDRKFGYGSIERKMGERLMTECFEKTLQGLVPRPEFAGHATFAHHDILEAPVPTAPADAVAIFNVLWHYPRETRDHIMAHVVQGLRPEGAFLFEGDTRESRQSPGYRAWIDGLWDYGIRPRSSFEKALNDTVRLYRPDRAEKIFVPSENVTAALGILAAASEVNA